MPDGTPRGSSLSLNRQRVEREVERHNDWSVYERGWAKDTERYLISRVAVEGMREDKAGRIREARGDTKKVEVGREAHPASARVAHARTCLSIIKRSMTDLQTKPA